MKDNRVTKNISSAHNQNNEFKTAQKITGDSWTIYRAISSNEWDVQLTGLNTSSQLVKRWKVTYQIEGGRNIPNAFAIFFPKVDTGNTITDANGFTYTDPTGFDYSFEDDGHDPLSIYYLIGTAYNWTNTTASFINVQFRAVSPYKGTIKFEEITL